MRRVSANFARLFCPHNQSFRAQEQRLLFRQAPYSLDWLFPNLKTTLERKRFELREEIMSKATTDFHSILDVFQMYSRRIPDVLPEVAELLKEVCELSSGVF